MKNIFNKRRRERREFENKVAFILESIGRRIGNLETVDALLWGSREQPGWIGRMQSMRNYFREMGSVPDEVKQIHTLCTSTALSMADTKSLAQDAATNSLEVYNHLKFTHKAVSDIASNTNGVNERLQNIVARLDAICARMDNLAKSDNFAEKVLETIKRDHVTSCERLAGIEEAVKDENSTFARTIGHHQHLTDIQINKIENLVTGRFGEAEAENKRLRQQVATLKGQVTRYKNKAEKAAHRSPASIGFGTKK